MDNKIFFEEGILLLRESRTDIKSLPWSPHPSFRGVSMKNIITGDKTGGRLSCHFVRIEPGCEIGNHKHDGKMELHEVVNGNGICTIGDKSVVYSSGVVSCIPENISHRVVAGDDGLYMLAKFTPALI
ncbi:MAG TPA: cupin domain-containing protein [Spirochaetota bacterium]|nr:cupin domain-containing protein [Spirochaetota bacterium]HPJ35246.1 cupin domain-containing protein [Spirochaetota bacterium]